MHARFLLTGPLLAGLLVTPLACGGSNSAAPSPGATTASGAGAGTVILVTNDDGVGAAGIDALVTRLRTLPNVSVQVVAPAKNQSGTGGRTTPGPLQHQTATTASGYPATSVNGYPADTVRVAIDDLKLRPALVVSGVNKGQNIGPIAGISGTVGAARAAAQRGIPAIAVSTGSPAAGRAFDYASGADYAVREAQTILPAGGATPSPSGSPNTSTIINLNVPSCAVGQVRGLQELTADTTFDVKALQPSDCTSTQPPSGEIQSFHNGFAVLTRIPARA